MLLDHSKYLCTFFLQFHQKEVVFSSQVYDANSHNIPYHFLKKNHPCLLHWASYPIFAV